MAKQYTLEDLARDEEFIENVKLSDISQYIDNIFINNTKIIAEKVALLKQYGYTELKVEGGKLPTEECTSARINHALKEQVQHMPNN